MKDPDDELREELEYHLSRRAELDRSNASEARRKFGNTTQIQEEMRAMQIPIWLDSLRQDLAYGIRTFARTPGFTIASVIALALGIGSVTAVFSVVDPLLFRPLPYAGESQLVSVGMSAPIEPDEWLLGPDYVDWREQQTAFTQMTETRGGRPCDLSEGDPVRLTCFAVESNFLSTFGVRPSAGRMFSPEEDQPGAAPVALISYALWQSRFGGNPQTIGRKLEIEGTRAEVIGVLPENFESPNMTKVDFLVPSRLDVAHEKQRQGMFFLRVYARLKPGVTLDQARESLKPLFDNAMKYVPAHFRKEVRLRVSSFRERQVRDFRTASLVLLGAVFLVLLVACANVANLMLARGSTREREMAVRAAIGASRTRLLRQTLTENMFLSGVAGVLGIALAYTLLAIFRGLAPGGIPRLATASVDLRVLGFAVAISVLAGALAGLAPALRLPSPESLTGARTTGPRRDWLRQILAAAQIAISLMLLLGSGLLIRSLWKIQQIDLGLQTDQMLTVLVDPGRGAHPAPETLRPFFIDMEQRLQKVPGVELVALSDALPPQDRVMTIIFSRIAKEGQPEDTRSGTGGMVTFQSVSSSYFQALRIPFVRGRAFSEEDRQSPTDLVVIDEALAQRLFPGEDPVGKRIRPGMESQWATIVGVARNTRNAGLFRASDPQIYQLLRDNTTWHREGLYVLVRTQRDERAIAPLIRAEIQRSAPKLPLKIEALDTRVRELSARERFNAMLLGLFAFFALALAAIGLAGVVSYLVAHRTQELGVRMAMGATPDNIRALVLSQSMQWIIAGAVAGLAGGLTATRWIKSLLYQVDPNDPYVIAAVTIGLVAIGMLAAWLPARRASRLDPMVALRHE